MDRVIGLRNFGVAKFDVATVDNIEIIQFVGELNNSKGTENSYRMSPGLIQGQSVLCAV